MTIRTGGRARRSGLAVLGAGAALLAVAAGWPGAGQVPASDPVPGPVPVTPVPGGGSTVTVATPVRTLPADLLIVSPSSLPAPAVAAIQKLPGVRAAEPVDAGQVRVNGTFTPVLGVDPASFRRFAAKPTASDAALWQSVAEGEMAVSYTMGRQAGLPPGSLVQVAGRTRETLRVGGLGTVGIADVEGVVSDAVARSLGFPVGNALVVSAPGAGLTALEAKIKAAVPRTALVELLVPPAAPAPAPAASAPGGPAPPAAAQAAVAAQYGLLNATQDTAFLRAAVSRAGMPYVWGAAGPTSFDCSGLVQWSLAQAGVVMPRVAADQARTGPAVPVSALQPGDLLFYHTDPTAPDYISHVAIYLGHGMMIQAPEPGMNVEIVPVDVGNEYAGAVAVSPAVAAAAAAHPFG
ncbi:MAG TPA: C40 family peptidase [Streptosporangiaceae bacterium]